MSNTKPIDNIEDLDGTEIQALVDKYLAENDVVGMQALVAQLNAANCYEDILDDLGDSMLSQDMVDMARACCDAEDIKEWCDYNPTVLILNCPKLFSEWMFPSAEAVGSVGEVLGTLPDEEKLDILQGRSTRLAGAFLYGALTDEPELWKKLSPAWIGDIDTPMRRAGLALGWEPSLLPVMVSDNWMSQVGSWTKAMRYPYSLGVACDAWLTTEVNNAKKRAGLAAGMQGKLANLVARGVDVVLDADPRDVALAEIILERIPMRNIELHKHPDAVALPAGERKILKSLVDMHISLDCLKLLVDALANDTLPGAVSETGMCLSLPDLESPHP